MSGLVNQPGTAPSAPSRLDGPSVVAAMALLLVAVVLGIASRKLPSLIPVSLFLIATLFVPERLRRDPHLIVYLLIGGVFILWQQSLDEVMAGLGGTRVHGTYFAAQTCLTCGAAALFAPRTQRSRLGWAMCFGAAALCFAGAGFPNWLARQNSWKQALPGLAEHITPRLFYAGAVF